MTRRWLPLLFALTAGLSALPAFSQSFPVTDQFSLSQALLSNNIITNFQSGAQITLSSNKVIEVATNLTIDGGSNAVVFSGANVTRLFHVHPKASLVLLNLQLYDGHSPTGACVYNEGTLLVSNCVFGGNSATNTTGASGVAGGHNSNGSDGSPGLPAAGGAIYSQGAGALIVLYSTFTNNSARGGNGGNGGAGISQFVFGGDGGNGGSGGAANGGAIYTTSSSNYVWTTSFENNSAVAGAGGLGGAPGGGRFAGVGGNGGVGAAAAGGAIFCDGPLTLGSSFLDNNDTIGGATATAGASANSFTAGSDGGSAVGGGLYLLGGSANFVTNTTILGNYCIGGIGGDTQSASAHAGNGGAVYGAGVASAARLAQVSYCTIATNLLQPGANGVGQGGGGNGSIGAAAGSQLYASPGAFRVTGAILAGGAPGTTINATDASDAGFNLSSDEAGVSQSSSLANRNPFLSVNASIVTAETNVLTNGVLVTNTSYPTADFELPVLTNSILETNLSYPVGVTFFNLTTILVPLGDGLVQTQYIYDQVLDYYYTNTSAVTNVTSTTNFLASNNGGPTPTVALDPTKSPAVSYIPGIPGISFPLQDQRLYYRVSPTTIGAYDPNGVATLSTTNAGTLDNYSIYLTNSVTNFLTNSFSEFDNVTNYTFTAQTNGTTNITFYDPAAGVTTNFTYSPTNVGIVLVQAGQAGVATNYFATDIPTPVIVGPTTVGLGQTATLTATVPTNVPGLGFQWRLNGTNLTNNAYYSGATTSNLVFRNITAKAAGNYDVIAGTIIYYTRTSSVVAISTAHLSKVAFTAPSPGARVSGDFLAVRGTFTLPDNVTNLNLWLTNLNDGSVTNIYPVDLRYGRQEGVWSAVVTPQPGTNILAAWADDSRGPDFASLVATRKFFEAEPVPLTVNTEPPGAGTESRRNGANLAVGQTYTITAKPGPKWVFANWSASTNGGPSVMLSESPALRFEMESNLALTATFATNVYATAAGTYNGLFPPTSKQTNTGVIGIITGLTLGRTGAYSARVFSWGFASNAAISGVFSPLSHIATNQIGTGSSALGIAMTLENGVITGSVSNATEFSPLLLERKVTTNTSSDYTLLFQPDAGTTNSPPGMGYALMTNHHGTVVISGALADGTAFSQSVGVSSDGAVPFYASLYTNGGAVMGWIIPGELTQSNLVWVKPSGSSLYPSGFTNLLETQSSLWTTPRAGNLAVPPLANGGTLTFSNGFLTVPVPFAVTLGANNRLTPADPASGQLLGVVNPKNGLLSVTLTNSGALLTGHGVLLQNGGANGLVGGGYFLTSTNSGAMILTTNAP